VKLDAEGAELPILKGMTDCLVRFRPVLVLEVNHACLRASDLTERDLLQPLFDAGYEIRQLRSRRGWSGAWVFWTTPFEETPLRQALLWTAVAIPRERSAAVMRDLAR
jgi:hypothetical protein